MSKLTYNTVLIDYCSTRDVAYDDIMSEDGIDYLYTKVTITVQGYLALTSSGGSPGASPQFVSAVKSPAAAAAPAPGGIVGGAVGAAGFGGGAAGAALTLVSAQQLLEIPRKSLLFQTDNVIIKADPTTDVRNGPFPQVLSINRIDSINAILVTFRVVTFKYNTPSASQKPIFVSNRWTEEETRNNQWLSHKTRTGKVVILGGAGQIDINLMKAVVTPAIPLGYVRDKVTFSTAMDGLSLSYGVYDREVVQLPPAPAVEADGDYTEVFPWPGAYREGTASIRFKGTRGWGIPSHMMQTGVAMCVRQLIRAGMNQDDINKKYAFELSLRHHYMSISVEVSLRTRFSATINKNPINDYAQFWAQPWRPYEACGTPGFSTIGNYKLQTPKPNTPPITPDFA